MSTLPLTRRVEDFARAVSGDAPARRSDVRPLVDLVDRLRMVEHPTLRPDFAAELRTMLVAGAQREAPLRRPARRPAPVLSPSPAPWGRRLALGATTFVVAGGAVGLVSTSAAALPGEMLYPVKRVGERVNLLVHTDPRDDGRILLGHAETRLAEAAGLLSGEAAHLDTDGLVPQTLVDFADQATQGGQILLDSYERTGSTADIEHLRSFTHSAASQLQSLAPALPESSFEAYVDATAAVGALDREAIAACPDCGGGKPAVDPAGALINAATEVVVTVSRQRDGGSSQVQEPQPAREASAPTPPEDGGGAAEGEAQGGPTTDPQGAKSSQDPSSTPPDNELPPVDLEPPTGGDGGTETEADPPPVTGTDTKEPLKVITDVLSATSDADPTGGGGTSPDPTLPTDTPTDAVTPLPVPITAD